jgi:hypothetical protein
MEDIEQIQKINSLAKELIRHGIADSSEEAFKKAKVMIRGEENVQEVTEERFEQEIRLLDSKIRTVAKEVKGVKEKLGRVMEEIKRLGVNESRTKSESVVKSVELIKEIEVEGNSNNPGKKEESKEERKFCEEDVSIEKIFYFGKK